MARSNGEDAPRARMAKLWRVVVVGGIALATACAGMQKQGSSGPGDAGSQGSSGSDGGGASGGGGGGAGGW